MLTAAKRLGTTALACVALLAVAAPAARAQIPVGWFDPYGTARTQAFRIRLWGHAMSHVPPYALGYNPYVSTAYYGGYPGSGGYAGSSGYGGYDSSIDPYSGYVRGSADLLSAQGRFLVNQQEANLKREQFKQAHAETRRKIFDEWLYERANTPTLQDERERLAKLDLRYHLTNPTSPEIYSGASLNTILDQLKQLQARNVKGTTVPLDDDLLRQINVTTGTGGNVALLKNDGQLSWPLALSGEDFAPERQDLERKLPEALKQAQNNKVAAGLLKDMSSDVERMLDRLGQMISDLTPSQYIEAKRYLNQLGDALRLLQSPDAMNYVTGKYSAKGKNVGELVKNMSGLRFAPAAPGEEKAYGELYQALTQYYNSAQQASRE
jgi:hypothetical protein